MEPDILGNPVLSSVNRPYADRRTGGSQDHFRTHRTAVDRGIDIVDHFIQTNEPLETADSSETKKISPGVACKEE